MIDSSEKLFINIKWRVYYVKYRNAKDILPPELLELLQRHVTGGLLYIPQKEGEKLRWGQLSGTRREVRERNAAIKNEYKNGASLYELANAYCLSESSIKKIIYDKRTG